MKRPYDTIGVARPDLSNPYHQRVLRKRNEYRKAMQQGVSLRSFRELVFTCSRCGSVVAMPPDPGYTCCRCCGQYFLKSQHHLQECGPPQNWQPQDPAQLRIDAPP